MISSKSLLGREGEGNGGDVWREQTVKPLSRVCAKPPLLRYLSCVSRYVASSSSACRMASCCAGGGRGRSGRGECVGAGIGGRVGSDKGLRAAVPCPGPRLACVSSAAARVTPARSWSPSLSLLSAAPLSESGSHEVVLPLPSTSRASCACGRGRGAAAG